MRETAVREPPCRAGGTSTGAFRITRRGSIAGLHRRSWPLGGTMMPIKIEKIEAVPMPVKSELEFVRERLAKAEDEITLLRETILELKVSLSTARLLAKEKAQLVLKLDEEVAQSRRGQNPVPLP